MKFVTRAEWGARPPKSTPSAISSEGTTGHWEGGGIWGGVIGDHARCASIVRAIQAYHMDHQGWTDIAYNSLSCPHEYVFEGRGPGRRSAANGTNTANSRSAVDCYIGGVGDPFPVEAKNGMLDAAEYLNGELKWGHRDWFSTQCPGDEIYEWIHSSPQRWSDTITEELTMDAVGTIGEWLHQMEERLSTQIRDSEERQNAKLPELLAKTVGSTIEVIKGEAGNADEIATKIVEKIADELKN